VASNQFLPFRENCFDKVVSVWGFDYDEETTRVLKPNGEKIFIYGVVFRITRHLSKQRKPYLNHSLEF